MSYRQSQGGGWVGADPLGHNLDGKVSKSVEDDVFETGRKSHVPNAVTRVSMRQRVRHDRQTGSRSPRTPGSFLLFDKDYCLNVSMQ